METDAFRPVSLAGHIRPLTGSRSAHAAHALRRRARAALDVALVEKPCACGDPDWHITTTRGRVRRVKCAACGRTGKVVL